MIGEVLVEMTADDATAELERAKERCQQDIDDLKARADNFKETLSNLKLQLYAKFGSNINLDMEEES